MSRELTDRDERMFQRRAEERAAEPLPIGTWIRRLAAAVAHRRGIESPETVQRAPMAAARPRPCEPA